MKTPVQTNNRSDKYQSIFIQVVLAWIYNIVIEFNFCIFLKVSPETEIPFFLGQESKSVQDLEIEKLKLENRKLHEEIQRNQLEKETLQAAKNLYNAKLMLILEENKEVAPSILGLLWVEIVTLISSKSDIFITCWIAIVVQIYKYMYL